MRRAPSLLILAFGLLAVPGSAADLTLGLEPLERRDAAGTQRSLGVLVTNRGDTSAGSLALRLTLAEGASAWGDGAAGCATDCDAGDSLEWSLPDLGPGEGTSLHLGIGASPRRDPETGSLRYLPVPFELRLFEAEALRATANVEVPTSERHLEVDLAVDREPIGPGETLTYTIAFRYADSPYEEAAPADAELRLELPEAASLAWASSGAVASGSSLRWRIRDLRRGEGGRRVAQVRVDESAQPGEILAAEVELGDRGGRLEAARAVALARVADPPAVELSLDLNPVGDVARFSNRGASATADLAYETLGSSDLDPIEPVGILQPGASDFSNGALRGSWSGGRLIGTHERPRVRAIDVEPESPRDLSLTLAADKSTVRPGDEVRYTLDFANAGVSAVTDVHVSLRLPPGTELASAEDGQPGQGGVVWQLGDLAPGEGERRSALVHVPPDQAAGSLLRALAVLAAADTVEQEVATHSIPVGDLLEVSLSIDPAVALPGKSTPVEVRLINRGEATLSSVWVGFNGDPRVHHPADIFLDGPLAPGEVVRLRREDLAIRRAAAPGALYSVRAIARTSIEGGVEDFYQLTDATLRLATQQPAVPAPDRVASRCQADQLRALAGVCERGLACGYSAKPKRCILGSIRRFSRAYEAALSRAARAGGSCPYSPPWSDLDWLLVSTLEDGRIHVSVENEMRPAPPVEQLERLAAALCRAELEAWAERAKGSAASDVTRARERFLRRAHGAVARAESRGWSYGGWTPEAIADMVRAAALRVAFYVGGETGF